MRTFDDVIDDIEKLKGMHLSSLSGSAKGITVEKIDRENKSVKLKVDDQTEDSRSFDELHKIWNVLRNKEFAHVESILSGSGSSRNRPETILASLPYIGWARYHGKKCLAYVENEIHDFGETYKMTEEEITSFEEEKEHKKVTVNYVTSYSNDKYHLNRIVFGAPGTGKSYQLEQDRKDILKNGGGYERITFYPNYTYSKFVGTYKPVSEGKDIYYRFVPGPFLRVFVEAVKSGRTADPKPFVLLIEEINRAQVSAVFGDVFQLLDRDEEGTSQYEIETSEDVRSFLAAPNQLGGETEFYKKIKIPNNMYIWATMNSADQGVFPMDTAFKRRWDFTYLGVDENDQDIRGKYVVVESLEKGKQQIEWNSLRKAINEWLAKEKINEDKQLGPYFISRSIVVPSDGGNEIDSVKFAETFKNKVLMYLFEDAARQRRERLFEGAVRNVGDHQEKINTNRYSEVCDAFDRQGIGIFNSDIQTEVKYKTLVVKGSSGGVPEE